MQLSGLVLDVYDDQSGEVLKSLYPNSSDIPHLVKTAHALSQEERTALPDDVFALVLLNDEGTSLRKYACVDPGNTVLAVNYFLCNHDKLPREAQKVAAANLVTACGWYDLPPPDDLVKMAAGTSAKDLLGNAALGFNVATTGARAVGAIEKGLQEAATSGGMVNPEIFKGADVSSTTLAPGQGPSNPPPGGTPSKFVVKKTAAVGHLVQGKEKHPRSEKSEELEQVPWHKGKTPAKQKQQKQITPHINVQGAEPPSPTKMKVSQITALPGRYPLDSYEQVKAASAYFDEYWKRFSPEERHEYCSSMVKRANALLIPVSDLARKYASSTYAPPEELEFALDTRRALVDESSRALLDKLATVLPTVEPEVFALALQEFDKTAGLHRHYDRDVPDAFFSTFGFTKEADFSVVHGNDYINEDRLKGLALSAHEFMCKRFGKDMADEFQKDPVGIFKSLPMEQQKILMRLAADEQPTRAES